MEPNSPPLSISKLIEIGKMPSVSYTEMDQVSSQGLESHRVSKLDTPQEKHLRISGLLQQYKTSMASSFNQRKQKIIAPKSKAKV